MRTSRHGVWELKMLDSLPQNCRRPLLTASDPLFITLPLPERLWSLLPLGQEMWQYSSLRIANTGEMYEKLQKFEDTIRKSLEDGELTMMSFAAPPWANPGGVFGDAFRLFAKSVVNKTT